jgi:hypothetical protein
VVPILHLAGPSQSAKLVSQDILDGVILDAIETTDVVALAPEFVALKAWEVLRFTPVLEVRGMKPSAVDSAQFMVFNRLIEPLSEWANRLAPPHRSSRTPRNPHQQKLKGLSLPRQRRSHGPP